MAYSFGHGFDLFFQLSLYVEQQQILQQTLKSIAEGAAASLSGVQVQNNSSVLAQLLLAKLGSMNSGNLSGTQLSPNSNNSLFGQQQLAFTVLNSLKLLQHQHQQQQNVLNPVELQLLEYLQLQRNQLQSSTILQNHHPISASITNDSSLTNQSL